MISHSAEAQICAFKGGVKDGTQIVKTYTGCMNTQISFVSNTPFYQESFVEWVWELNGNNVGTSDKQDVARSFNTPGEYTVRWKGFGTAGDTCKFSFKIIIQPSPTIELELINSDTQCFESNEFCFRDSTYTDPNSSITRITPVFSDGTRYDFDNPDQPRTWCFTTTDPTGGFFDLVYEAEDATGCVSRVTLSDAVYVTERLGVEFVNRTPQPNPGCDSTLGRFENVTALPLSKIKSFCWDFGDGTVICGDATTNTEWWYGPNNDGFIEHMYTQNGTFDGKLTVTSVFDCAETFTWKAAVTNIVLKPVIIADKDSSCVPDNPVNFRLQGGPPSGASAWLWNFGDPPSGPLNFNDEDWEVSHNYGPGPWMISLRIIAGPCDVTVYDTITKIGPGSTIEVPFGRVAQDQTYQCYITDSVQFVNNSTFYHNDPWPRDEDSVVYEYRYIVNWFKDFTTNFDYFRVRRYEYGEVVGIDTFNLSDTANLKGFKAFYNSTKDSIGIIENGVTTYYPRDFYGHDPKLRYAFDYDDNAVPPAGPQTALTSPEMFQKRWMHPHVWRVWDFGDQYAPQCTTDSRVWVNKNVGINCAWSIDSLPIHWYTPWDEIYKTQNNGNFYRTPLTKSVFNRNTRTCYQIGIYADSTIVIKGDTILTVPYGQFLNYQGETVGALTDYPTGMIGSFKIRRPPASFKAPKIYLEGDTTFIVIKDGDTTRVPKTLIGRDSVIGSFTWTVVKYDMDFDIPNGVTVIIDKLAAPGGGGAGVGSRRTVTGPQTITIEADEQFTIFDGDEIFPIITIEENENDTFYAQPSTYLYDSATYNLDGSFKEYITVTRDSVFVDSAAHREDFYLERAQCFTVTLMHQDTVHDFMCKAEDTKSLALIPPSAEGMEITSGIPCPFDGNNFSYVLEFDLGETKPGCTQQWFAVNYDTLADPTAFNVFNGGAVLAPPAPGNPIPFALPYQIVGNVGTKFVKGYSPGEIGNDPTLRDPNGSFTVGLIVGNGQPDPNGGPPACLDTTYYGDMFRILYLNAGFTIVSPTQDIKAICAGGDAYFMINEPIQDSIRTLRWNWGYQGFGRGVNLATYIEQFEYYQRYDGPSPTRNDRNVAYNGEDWLYNYVIRQELSDVTGLKTIDTIVTQIIYDWKVVVNTDNADDAIEDALEQIGFDINDLTPEELALMLGDGTFGCLDTTGLSQFFDFGIQAYSEDEDPLVYRDGDKRFRYLDESRTTSVQVSTIYHFRDSSLIGFDSLALDTNFDGNPDMLRGLWKYTYRHPKIVTDPCDGTKDTIYEASNGPMLPNLFLTNTVGCEARGAALLNVGFLNDYWLDDTSICNGLEVRLNDTLRYWQYGDNQWPQDYPIDPRNLWNDPARYTNNIETYEADWDASDGLNDFERSISLNHIYNTPGTYTITVVAKDSINCYDTVEVKAYITDVEPRIALSQELLNCNWVVDFQDSSIVFDPCRISDTCKNGKVVACDSVVSWEWDFGDGTRTSPLKNPSHVFTSGGYFDITLTVRTLLGCEETVVRQIYIPGPQPEFEFNKEVWRQWDSAVICVGDSVDLRNLSGGIKSQPSWEMIWGDGNRTNPGDSNTVYVHQYNKVGTFELYLIQEDEIPGTNIRCSRIFPDTNPDLISQRKIKVVVLPRRPANLIIEDTVLCPGEITDFIASVDTVYTQYSWNFGDGDTSFRNRPDSIVQHSYEKPGTYMVTMTPEYFTPQFIPVCPDTDTAFVYVDSVKASFSIDSTEKPNFCFINESVNATQYSWTFEDETTPGTSTDENPCYNWDDRIGEWEICLTATSAEGCEDDTCITIRNTFQTILIPYNAFTPGTDNNGDLVNDEFVIDGKGLEEYNIKIFNRWGELVFQSNDINVSWNGQVNNDGAQCPAGTYYYVINYRFLYGEDNEGQGPIEGMVELIRKE
ncbi:PKD domain-containing protein [bacterium]|nr:PKD domain-containing protein [bacterium]